MRNPRSQACPMVWQFYTKFTNGSGNYATYQLTLNTDKDVVVK